MGPSQLEETQAGKNVLGHWRDHVEEVEPHWVPQMQTGCRQVVKPRVGGRRGDRHGRPGREEPLGREEARQTTLGKLGWVAGEWTSSVGGNMGGSPGI